ncbi:MAG: hypothetical protein QOF37_603, partial [Thermoleophilaceae bacterium]|nr:hypothetical protein [Thermoleophilaceae bacterium]
HGTADLGATFAAALGVALPDVDGRPIASILPAGAASARFERVLARRADRRVPPWARRSVAARPVEAEQPEAPEAAPLEGRVAALERQASVSAMSAWLQNAHVPEDLLVSVVMATRDRSELLAEAIASVKALTYPRWELLVIDDGSVDDTAALLARDEDPRLRRLAGSGEGECAARNVGVDAAHGDVIAYLDDDNRFDPQWLKAVAATFNALPDASVAYGARVCDDHGRMERKASSGRPWLVFVPWDERAARDFNVADTNVLAHRRSPVRFDETLTYFGDWDLLLRLSQHAVPVEIPAIAVYYRTDAEERMTTSVPPEEMDRQYWAVRGKFDDGRGLPDPV